MGLDRDPKAAMQAAVGAFEARSVQSGQGPHMRMAAGFSDGKTLYALRYASDDLAPSMFYQWNEDWQGWSVVSEPYDTALGNWIEVPKGSFCRFTASDVEIEPFAPTFMQAEEPGLLAV